jgi:hypothetical protein
MRRSRQAWERDLRSEAMATPEGKGLARGRFDDSIKQSLIPTMNGGSPRDNHSWGIFLAERCEERIRIRLLRSRGITRS